MKKFLLYFSAGLCGLFITGTVYGVYLDNQEQKEITHQEQINAQKKQLEELQKQTKAAQDQVRIQQQQSAIEQQKLKTQQQANSDAQSRYNAESIQRASDRMTETTRKILDNEPTSVHCTESIYGTICNSY